MPEAILRFNLPEETEEHQTATDGGKWKSLVWNLDQWLRNEIKYNGKNEYQPVRDMIHEMLNDASLNIE